MSEVKKVLTKKFRVSFPNVFKPHSFNNGDPFYSITMLFDKDTDISDLKKLANAAKKEKWEISHLKDYARHLEMETRKNMTAMKM